MELEDLINFITDLEETAILDAMVDNGAQVGKNSL